jgi:hypothetical protein
MHFFAAAAHAAKAAARSPLGRRTNAGGLNHTQRLRVFPGRPSIPHPRAVIRFAGGGGPAAARSLARGAPAPAHRPALAPGARAGPPFDRPRERRLRTTIRRRRELTPPKARFQPSPRARAALRAPTWAAAPSRGPRQQEPREARAGRAHTPWRGGQNFDRPPYGVPRGGRPPARALHKAPAAPAPCRGRSAPRRRPFDPRAACQPAHGRAAWRGAGPWAHAAPALPPLRARTAAPPHAAARQGLRAAAGRRAAPVRGAGRRAGRLPWPRALRRTKTTPLALAVARRRAAGLSACTLSLPPPPAPARSLLPTRNLD